MPIADHSGPSSSLPSLPHETGQEAPPSLPPAPAAPPFDVGRLVATPGALSALMQSGVTPAELLARHTRQDWGDVDLADRAANDRAVLEGTRLLSAYTLPVTSDTVWVITEADRSATTLLLPEEY